MKTEYAYLLPILLAATACGEADGAAVEEGPRPVKTVVVGASDGLAKRSFPGTVEATAEVELAFRVGGPVVAFPVKEGQRFSKGELLARIDPRDYRVQVRSAEARLAAAKAQRTHADRDHERVSKLASGKVVPTARLDDASARRDIAEAELLASERALEAAQLALRDTSLRAPFDGTVAVTRIERHQTVGAGQPVLVFQTEGPLEVHVDVPEGELDALLAAEASSLSVRFPELGGASASARVDAHRARVDAQTRTFQVVVLVEDAPSGVTPGMTAELEWRRASKTPRLTIPVAAVGSDPDGGKIVFVVEQGKLRKLDVELGGLAGTSVEVRSGLKAGQQLLVAGISSARAGQVVRPLSAEDIGG